MEIFHFGMPAKYEIALAGDTHEGTVLQSRDGIEALKDWVQEKKHRYMIHMGDEIEAIATDDPRYSLDCTSEPVPMVQAQNVIQDFYPIRKKILCWLAGNHPLKLIRFGNLTKYICDELNVHYGTWSSKLIFSDLEGVQFKIFVTHGMRGNLASNAKDSIQRLANLRASLKVKLQRKSGDCSLMACGHFHQLLIVEPSGELYLHDDGMRIKQGYLQTATGEGYINPDSRWYACTGSFYKLYAQGMSSYSEIAGYDPTEIGFVIATVEERRIVNVRKVVV
jgi:predicted phosphodiesterase